MNRWSWGWVRGWDEGWGQYRMGRSWREVGECWEKLLVVLPSRVYDTLMVITPNPNPPSPLGAATIPLRVNWKVGKVQRLVWLAVVAFVVVSFPVYPANVQKYFSPLISRYFYWVILGAHIPTRLSGDASDAIVGDWPVGEICRGVTHTLTNSWSHDGLFSIRKCMYANIHNFIHTIVIKMSLNNT